MVRIHVRAAGLYKYQVAYVRQRTGFDEDGDRARFVNVGVRPRKGHASLDEGELDSIVKATKRGLGELNLSDRFTYIHLEDA